VDGLFAFTFQLKDGDGFILGADLRYHHSEAHLRACATTAGLMIVHAAPCITRRDGGKPVDSMVMILSKTVP
jgi:predicted TPR repeat methyltransferase